MHYIFLTMILIFLAGIIVAVLGAMIYFIKSREWLMVALVIILICGLIGSFGLLIIQ